MKLLLLLGGLLLIVEGLPYLTFPEAMKKWLAEVAGVDNGKLRLIGLISVIVGFAILLAARQGGWLG
ncbi:MAG: DUF2065 domain-containing protein [Desulfobulbaceae bacterium]|jgi:uncharacterized protein YjeT (DUF2065 family)|nr:DUF2065 domain-containing protein [Desulfobulbaceae bacterium]